MDERVMPDVNLESLDEVLAEIKATLLDCGDEIDRNDWAGLAASADILLSLTTQMWWRKRLEVDRG